MASSATLSHLADQYSREFSECLSTILPDTPDKINDSKTIHKGMYDAYFSLSEEE
jgi:hypothetical protein